MSTQGRVADRERNQVARPFAARVDADALVVPAPLTSYSANHQALVGHDDLGAGIVHQRLILNFH